MLVKATMPRVLIGLASRNFSVSCQINRSKKSGDSSKIKEDSFKKTDDSLTKFDDSWKWNSNYFKNHWNRETFGPTLTK